MAARRKTSSPQQAKNNKQGAALAEDKKNVVPSATTTTNTTPTTSAKNALAEAHLPPLFLVGATLLCSGFLLVLALRDFCTTGRNLLGDIDEAFLVSNARRRVLLPGGKNAMEVELSYTCLHFYLWIL